MEPNRILQVVTIMNRGGLETMLMNYYRKLDRNKIQFDFMVHREEKGHYDDEILSLGGRIYRMPQIRPGNYRSYFKLLDKFFTAHPEYKVVHSHINENSSFVLGAAKRAAVPCRIAHSHLSDLGIDIKLPFRLYARFSMKDNPNKYFACSKNAGQWLFGRKICESKEVTVLNNAVNVEEFQYDETIRKQIRKEIGAEDKLVLGHIGRFNKQKNHDFLIDVFKAVHDKNPNSLLVMVGDGQLRPLIEKKVAALGLSSHVRFLGVRGDISSLMQGFDLFLFPSLFEGLPVVLVEAQAAGLKCVISDTITDETDVSGRIEFVSLKETPEVWVEKILTSSYDHEDTSDLLRKNGYDTATMAKWLTDYYLDHSYI
ncbi:MULTISPECIES: glycosyltransferase family 1 protein [unclassified Bacillus (in: firmicutes)]|uniref:glycosyltransferase family 1 protein n=1 Tax=unclassified Bacillus (in: firmicutes) TaxID=185979 RepID=UPI0008E1A5B6|nr:MULTISPECIES: glycosyltransferase family 1 protein [unclassified Bacillus (in: firmicutes)]SFI28688.1 Glycosyltransferase involved in cell wall bisynthesis [Bacillus sp. 71mf]SFS39280.1 Glycosyltransferase involved in cell wall bisynthesis [Bacillus sp. 103mf]